MLDRLRELQEFQKAAVRGPGTGRAYRPIRNGVPLANLGAGSGRQLKRTRERLRTVRTGLSQARHICRQLSAGAASGGKGREVHSAVSSRVGSARQPAQGDRHTVPRNRSAGSGPRSLISNSAACSTTRWSFGAASSAAPIIRKAN